MASSPSSVSLPSGWAVTQLAIHEETADETGGVPYAGTVVVHLRMDAARGARPSDLMAGDLALFKTSFDDFELVDEGSVRVGPASLPKLEYALTQQEQRLQQLVVYFNHNEDVYTLTATHRAGPAFERVRGTVEGVLSSFIG